MAGKRTLVRFAIARRTRPTRRLKAQRALIAATLLWIVGLLPGGALYGASTEQGILEIRIKDHREAIGDFSRFTVKLGAIAISPKPGLAFWKTAWRELPPSQPIIDLTKYTGKESVAVFSDTINSGAFDAIQLRIDGTEAILKTNQRQVAVKNLLTPIKFGFVVPPEGSTVIIIDLVVLDMSDHPPRGYELGIRGYELFINGKLVDKVPPG